MGTEMKTVELIDAEIVRLTALKVELLTPPKPKPVPTWEELVGRVTVVGEKVGVANVLLEAMLKDRLENQP